MSEANIQANFFRACVSIGLNCTLELLTPKGRLDAAIFSEDWNSLLAIVECKNYPSGKMYPTKQIRRYKEIGVPVYGLCKIERAERLAKTIKENVLGPGIALEQVMALERFRRRKRRTKRLMPTDVDEFMNWRS